MIWNLKLLIPSKFDYKLNIILLGVRFIGKGLEWDIVDVVILLLFFTVQIYDLILVRLLLIQSQCKFSVVKSSHNFSKE
jgi:hypothetical protein